jgi:hypothetical protein
MSFNVALTFRDNVVHRIKCDTLEAAQGHLKDIAESIARYEFKDDEGTLIYVCNLNNFLFAFIEEAKQTIGESE